MPLLTDQVFPGLGADGSSREAIRDGALWKFLTVRQIYPLTMRVNCPHIKTVRQGNSSGKSEGKSSILP